MPAFRLRPHCLALAATLAFVSGAASADTSPVAPPRETDVVGIARVPLVRVGGLPAVAVSINASKPRLFVIDWAANLLAISPTLAQEMNLPDLGMDEMRNRAVAVAVLSIGTAQFKGLTAAVDPFLLGHEEAGVLGVNVYHDVEVTLDFVHDELSIKRGRLQRANGSDVFSYQVSPGGAPMIPIEVCSLRLSANIDTAAQAVLRLPTKTMDRLGCRYKLSKTVAVVGAQSGRTQAIDARLNGDVRIGGTRLAHPIVRFGAGSETFIGVGLLKNMIVTLDQRSHLVRLTSAVEP